MESSFLPSFQLYRRDKLGEHKDTNDKASLRQVHILTIKPHKQFSRPSGTPTYFWEKLTATAATTRSNKSLWFKCRILPGEGPNCGSNFTMSFLVPQKFQVKSNLKENWKWYGRITGEQS